MRVGLLFLVLAIAGCATDSEPGPSSGVEVRYVYVTPEPTPTAEPTPVPTPDLRTEWNPLMCEAVAELRHAYYAYLEASEEVFRGDDPEFWIEQGRGSLEVVAEALDNLPAIDDGSELATAASTLMDGLTTGLDAVEAGDDGDTLSIFDQMESLYFAANAASVFLDAGCSLRDLVYPK